MNSSPFSYASTGLWTITLGMPGIAWVTMSSRLGSTAEVMATESPSQPRPVVIQMTWASTASVFAWSGTNSTALAISPPVGYTIKLSTDPGQRIAHQLVHHSPAAEGRLHQHHPGRLRLHLSDLRRFL